MDKQRVFVTRPIQPEAFELLEGHFHVEANKQDRLLDRQSLIDGVRDADGLLCLINDRIDREIIEAAGKLRIIANYGVGYDNIDIEAATQRGIVVTNTPGVLTDATADLVWALMFAVARRIVESDRFARAGMYESWSPTLLLGQEIRGKRLGIIGAGRIGRAVAKRSRGFDMEVVYTGILFGHLGAKLQPFGSSVGSGIRPIIGVSLSLSLSRSGIEPNRPIV
jgi:glyoxylate reductase